MNIDNLEWYCDSCDWVGDFVDTLYCNDPMTHPQCPNCNADDSIHCRNKVNSEPDNDFE
jgi:hypothetical protein